VSSPASLKDTRQTPLGQRIPSSPLLLSQQGRLRPLRSLLRKTPAPHDNLKMGTFAWRNLLTRPLRTILALIGLSVPILGIMGLFSVSNGLRDLVGDTLSQIEGVMVIGKTCQVPFSARFPRAWPMT